MKVLNMAVAAALVTMGSSVMAEGKWKTAVEAGLVLTSGNTETQSTNLKSVVEHESDKWRNEAKFEALNVKGKEGRLSERYVASGKSSLKFNETSYSFLTVDGEHDPFSGFAYQVGGALGYGYRLIGTETTTLDFEGGPGYRETRVRGVDESVGEGVLRLSGLYTQKLSKTSEFSESIVSTVGEQSTITKSITSVTAKIAGDLSMKTSLTIRNNTKVPAGVKKTDTETAVTLVYTF